MAPPNDVGPLRSNYAVLFWRWPFRLPLGSLCLQSPYHLLRPYRVGKTSFDAMPIIGETAHIVLVRNKGRRIVDATLFHLPSMVPIVQALHPALLLEDEALDKLTTRLEVGLPVATLPLLAVPTLTRDEPAARPPGHHPARCRLGNSRAGGHEAIRRGSNGTARSRLAADAGAGCPLITRQSVSKINWLPCDPRKPVSYRARPSCRSGLVALPVTASYLHLAIPPFSRRDPKQRSPAFLSAPL